VDNQIKYFGDAALKLSRSPLGIIALFILLVYGFACLVSVSGHLTDTHRTILIWFIVAFPTMVLFTFAWLICNHHSKLYSPSDYQDETNFIKVLNPEIANLPVVVGEQIPDKIDNSSHSATTEDWVKRRDDIYKRSHNYFLAYVLEPSPLKTQKYDIFIYLILHKDYGYENYRYGDIERVEFFFGHYWGNKIYVGSQSGQYIGVRTSAYGPFLALCKITFKNGESIFVDKYIDFEMGAVVGKLLR